MAGEGFPGVGKMVLLWRTRLTPRSPPPELFQVAICSCSIYDEWHAIRLAAVPCMHRKSLHGTETGQNVWVGGGEYSRKWQFLHVMASGGFPLPSFLSPSPLFPSSSPLLPLISIYHTSHARSKVATLLEQLHKRSTSLSSSYSRKLRRNHPQNTTTIRRSYGFVITHLDCTPLVRLYTPTCCSTGHLHRGLGRPLLTSL